jgi:hypothetical protein
MATGQNYMQTVVVPGNPEIVQQNLIAAVMGTKGYTVTSPSPNTLILSRRYTPTWAIVVGIVVGLFTLIGFALLLYKVTETMTAALSPVDNGTRISFSGVASSEMIAKLAGVVASLGGTPMAGMPAGGALSVPSSATAGMAQAPTASTQDSAPFQKDGKWWARRADGLLMYDEASQKWMPAPPGTLV